MIEMDVQRRQYGVKRLSVCCQKPKTTAINETEAGFAPDNAAVRDISIALYTSTARRVVD
ncbi:hypothetical protein HI914_05909 [Erysiphe necator]|nr:hypothetical protein HI914_05909 [Erysiphe necator]